MNVTEQNWELIERQCTMGLSRFGLRRCRKLMFSGHFWEVSLYSDNSVVPSGQATDYHPFLNTMWENLQLLFLFWFIFGSFSGFVGFWIIYALSAWTFMIFWLYLFINNWKILVFIMDSYLQPVLQQFIYAIIVYVKWYLSK